MTKSRKRGDEIKRFILENIPDNPNGIVLLACEKFSLSRQSINRYMNELIKEGAVIGSGKTRGREYKLKTLFKEEYEFKLDGLEEHRVWEDVIYPRLINFPENVIDIWHYGCTEMINNAIDHSEGQNLRVIVEWNAVNLKVWVDDDGIGIFRKITKSLNLEDERHAVLELAKGKLTTDPDNHTGEGIFFSSRMFDDFIIFSGDVNFSHTQDEDEDWIFERDKTLKGTQVYMCLNNQSKRTDREIFDMYASPDDDFGFNKTVVPVKLIKQGHEKLVSRSQAKRLMKRVDRFKIVLLDFRDIENIGQAFADEIFRVFASQHPEIKIEAVFENEEISKMIKRAKNVNLNH